MGVGVQKCGGGVKRGVGGDVGKCVGVWGKLLECGGSVLECGRSEGRCGEYGIFYPFSPPPSPTPHLPFHPPTLLHTPTHFFTSPSTISHSFHIPPILDPTPQTTKNFPIPPPSILLQTPPNFLYSLILPHTPSPRTPHSYFTIYPTPKLLTFLIYCQVNSAIKYTSNSL